MRHLVAHLVASHRLDDLYTVLTLDHAGRNAWHHAKRAASDLAGYFADLELADTAALKAGQLTRRITYAVMRASTRASSSSLPVMVQCRLVETGAWGPSEVIASVTAQASPFAMALAFRFLADGLSDAADWKRLEELIVHEARRAADPAVAARALCQLALKKDARARTDLMKMTLDAAERIPPGQDRYAVLGTIAGKQLGAPQTIVHRALTGMLALLTEHDEYSQARSLSELVHDVAPTGRHIITGHIAGFTEPKARGRVLKDLLAEDPAGDVMTMAHECLQELDDPGDELGFAAALAARMPTVASQHLLGNVWSTAQAQLTPAAVPDVINAMGIAEGSLRDSMLARAINLADRTKKGSERLSCYAAIAAVADETTRTHINDRIIDDLIYIKPRLSGTDPLGNMGEWIAAVVRLARVDRDEYAWFVNLALDRCYQLGDFGEVALHHVASFAQGDDVNRVLDHALQMRNTVHAASALGAIAPQLTGAQHLAALQGARQFSDPLDREEALVALAKAIPDELFASTALDTVAAIPSYHRRIEVINELVGRADPDALSAWVALASTSDHADPIARLKLSLLTRCRGAAQQALLESVLENVRDYAQVPAATWNFLWADEALKNQQWSASNELGQAAATAERHRWWLAALSAPRDEFPARQRDEMLTLAREFAAAVRDQAARAVVQARIALAHRDQQLLDEALQAARSCDPASAAITLAKIAGLLPAAEAATLIQEANQIVGSLPEASPVTKLQERVDFSGIPTQEESPAVTAARVLAASPHHLPDASVDSAAERAREIQDWGVRAELLAALSRAVEPTLAAQLFHQAKAEIGLISGWIDELQAPGWTIIPHEIKRSKRQLITALTAVAAAAAEVDEGLLQQLVAAANAEESSAVAASILEQLPARCHDRTRAPTALVLVGGLTNPIVRRWALGYFEPPPAPDLGRIAATLDVLASRQPNELLGDLGCLGPLLASACTADSAEELMDALDQITQWWP